MRRQESNCQTKGNTVHHNGDFFLMVTKLSTSKPLLISIRTFSTHDRNKICLVISEAGNAVCCVV